MVRLSVLILKEGGREGIGHSNTVGGRTFKNSDWRNTRDFHRDLLFYFAWYIFENIYACGSCHLCFGKSDSSHLALPTHPPPLPTWPSSYAQPRTPLASRLIPYRGSNFFTELFSSQGTGYGTFYFYAAFQGTRIGMSSHFQRRQETLFYSVWKRRLANLFINKYNLKFRNKYIIPCVIFHVFNKGFPVRNSKINA